MRVLMVVDYLGWLGWCLFVGVRLSWFMFMDVMLVCYRFWWGRGLFCEMGVVVFVRFLCMGCYEWFVEFVVFDCEGFVVVDLGCGIGCMVWCLFE